jgi:hypothetical protein
VRPSTARRARIAGGLSAHERPHAIGAGTAQVASVRDCLAVDAVDDVGRAATRCAPSSTPDSSSVDETMNP